MINENNETRIFILEVGTKKIKIKKFTNLLI